MTCLRYRNTFVIMMNKVSLVTRWQISHQRTFVGEGRYKVVAYMIDGVYSTPCFATCHEQSKKRNYQARLKVSIKLPRPGEMAIILQITFSNSFWINLYYKYNHGSRWNVPILNLILLKVSLKYSLENKSAFAQVLHWRLTRKPIEI